MATILYKDEVLAKNDGAKVSGYALVRSYAEQPTKSGKTYYNGSVEVSGSVSFKVWQGTCFNKMQETDFSDTICLIEADVNEWNGMKSLVLTNITAVPNEALVEMNLKKSDFLAQKYDTSAYWKQYISVIRNNVSENAYKVFTIIMEDIQEAFVKEFAAINYHDNCVGGLLAHSTKVVKLSTILSLYPAILKRVSPDVLYVGSAIHDIGKIYEYTMGVISQEGRYISHLTIGIAMLDKHREQIVELKGTAYYNTLLSIISQHHGEYGERPRTIAAYIIHQIDTLESTLALLNQSLEDTPDIIQINFDDCKLI